MTPVRFEGTLTQWNDERGFGHVQPTLGGEPVFVHISAWPKGAGRPQLKQAVSFEVDTGPRGKRARDVQIVQARRARAPSARAVRARWGTASLFALPAFLVVFTAVSVVWRLPMWVAALYALASGVTFIAYAAETALEHDPELSALTEEAETRWFTVDANGRHAPRAHAIH